MGCHAHGVAAVRGKSRSTNACAVGRGGIDGAGDTRIEALADKVIAQISNWTGIDDLASRITVRRTVGPGNFATELNAWRGTALGPAHTLKQSAFFRAGNKSKKVDGLYFVGGSTIPGIGLPMCLISAEVLLKRLRGDTSTEPLTEPLVSSLPLIEEADGDGSFTGDGTSDPEAALETSS